MPVAFTVTSTASACVNPNSHKLLAQRAPTAFAPLYGLVGFFCLGTNDLLGIVARGRARFLGLTSLVWSNPCLLSLLGFGLLHFKGQAHPEVVGDRTDIGQLSPT